MSIGRAYNPTLNAYVITENAYNVTDADGQECCCGTDFVSCCYTLVLVRTLGCSISIPVPGFRVEYPTIRTWLTTHEQGSLIVPVRSSGCFYTHTFNNADLEPPTGPPFTGPAPSGPWSLPYIWFGPHINFFSNQWYSLHQVSLLLSFGYSPTLPGNISGFASLTATAVDFTTDIQRRFSLQLVGPIRSGDPATSMTQAQFCANEAVTRTAIRGLYDGYTFTTAHYFDQFSGPWTGTVTGASLEVS